MPIDFSKWDSSFLDDKDRKGVDLGEGLLNPNKVRRTSTTPESIDFAMTQRGTLGDVASMIGRGAVATLETLENAAEFFNLNDSTVDSASKLRNFEFLKPDIDEYFNTGWLQETPFGSIPSAFESMGPSLAVAGAGAAAGAAIGSGFFGIGAIPGGIVGGVLASMGIMGTAEYQNTYETAIENGIPEDQARKAAWANGVIEGFGESAGTLIGASPLIKPFVSVAKKGLTQTLKELMEMGWKKAAKELFTVYAGEQVTEFGQAIGQNEVMKSLGLSTVSDLEAAMQTVIPTMFMTGSFQLATQTLNKVQKTKLKNTLDVKNNKADRYLAADMIYRQLGKQDKQIAENWKAFATEHIEKGKAISWDEDFGKFASDLVKAHEKPGEIFTDQDIINGTVSDRQLAAFMAKEDDQKAYNAFERALLGLNKEPAPLEVPEPVDKTNALEKADELIRKEEAEADRVKREEPVQFKPMSREEATAAYTELDEIDKVLENPDIPLEKRLKLGERAASLRAAVTLPRSTKTAPKGKVQETVESSTEQPGAKPAEKIEAPTEQVPAEAELSPHQQDIQSEIQAREAEIDQIDEMLAKGPSQQTRKVFMENREKAVNAIETLKAASEEPTESPIATREIAEEVIDKLTQAQQKLIDEGKQDLAAQVGKQIKEYQAKLEALPRESNLTPERVDELRQDYTTAISSGEDLSQSLLEAEAQADQRAGVYDENAEAADIYDQGVSIYTEAESPNLGEWQREVDLPSRIIHWTQDLAADAGARTSNMIIGRPRGIGFDYQMVREKGKDGNWYIYKVEPGQKAVLLMQISTRKAKLKGLSARTLAAEWAEDHARKLGSSEWLPGNDEKNRNTYGILQGGDRILITELSKNKFMVEVNGDLVERELPSGQMTDHWASLSVGQVKKLIEDLYGFETQDTKKELLTAKLREAHLGQKEQITPEKSRVQAAREEYMIFEPVVTPEMSAQMSRKGPTKAMARDTAAYDYIGQEMTPELRAEIEDKIQSLIDKIGYEEARRGFTVREQPGNIMINKYEDDISSLRRILIQTNNGKKVRVQIGTSVSGRAIYARKPKAKPKKELSADRTVGKKEYNKVVKEVKETKEGPKPKSPKELAAEKAELEKKAEQYPAIEETLDKIDEKLLRDMINDQLVKMGYKPIKQEVPVETPRSRPAVEGFERPPVLPQAPQQAISEETGEIESPEVGSFEQQMASDARQEVVEEARNAWHQERETYISTMLDKVQSGKSRELTSKESLYYTAVFDQAFTESNPFYPYQVMPEIEQPVTPSRSVDIPVQEGTERDSKLDRRKDNERRKKLIRQQKRMRGPTYLQDGGVPVENNAWEILENNQDDPIVKHLMKFFNQEDLQNVPVYFDPMAETSYFQANPDGTKFIVLRGDNPFIGTHEAVHAALGVALEQNPEARKELLEMMDRFKEQAEEMGLLDHLAVQKALENSQEFVAQAGADPVVQAIMESKQVKEGLIRNLWTKFVNWGRELLGMPKSYNNMLGEILNMIEKVAPDQASRGLAFKAEGPKVKETAIERRERIRRTHREARAKNKNQSWLGESYKGIGDWFKSIMKYSSTFAQPVNDALYNIEPRLAALMRIREAQLSARNKKQMMAVHKLAVAIKGFSEDELTDFKSGWINVDERQLLTDLIKEKGIEAEWKTFMDIIQSNEKKFLKLGVLSPKTTIEGYLPRVVKDPLGLVNAMEGTPEGEEFSARIREERIRIEKMGGIGAFDKAHEEEFIAKMVLNRRYNTIPKKGFVKMRILDHVPDNLLEYYHDPVESMIDYIHHANELLFQRELSGKSNRSDFLQKLSKAVDEYHRTKAPKKRMKLSKEIDDLSQQIYDIDKDTKVAVDKLIQVLDIPDAKKKEAIELIYARLNQRGTSGAVRALKNVTLMMTIGNPLSAITQLGDQGFNIMDNGVYGIAGVSKALTGNKIIDNFDIDNYLREFAKEGGTSDLVNKLLTVTGLKRMDTFGKESYVQGLMAKVKSWSFEQFKDKFGIYGEFLEGTEDSDIKLKEAYDSIISGNTNMNAMYMLFSELAKRQPVSLSETSKMFLTGGQARLLWVLKQFALRTISSVVQDIRMGFQEGTTAGKVRGISKAVGLMLVLGMAGAGTDAIKDLILGRDNPESFTDDVLSNIMDILFINRYTLERGLDMHKPVSSLIANNLMIPPARAADAVITDLLSTLQGDFSYTSMAHVPAFGRIAFEYTPMGVEAEGKRLRTKILDLAEKGASQEVVLKAASEWNSKYYKKGVDGLERISGEVVKNARKRGKE